MGKPPFLVRCFGDLGKRVSLDTRTDQLGIGRPFKTAGRSF